MDNSLFLIVIIVALLGSVLGFVLSRWIEKDQAPASPKKAVDSIDTVTPGDETLKTEDMTPNTEETVLKSSDKDHKNENEFAIKDLEGELEAAENAVSRYKQMVELQKQENISLMDDLRNANRSIKELNTCLEETKTVLDETQKELQTGNDSLSFIKEILTASCITNETIQEKENKINALFTFVSTHFKNLYSRYISETLPQEIFGNGLTQWAIVKRKTWIEGKKTIAFIGEFSAGKTSIVNRILSQDNPDIIPLPVKSEATTAIPTYIAGGPITHYYFYSPDGLLKSISEDTFKKVSKSILEKVDGVLELIKYFVMTYDNPNLEGLSILDTPGFGSGEQEDAFRTIDVINECDALFWVVDVTNGNINASSLKVIKENMTRPLYVIINKIDLRAEVEIDDVENRIRETFDDNGIDVKGYIRFHDGKSVDEIMNTISSIHRNSSAEDYLNTLSDELSSILEDCKADRKTAEEEYSSIRKECTDKEEEISQLCLKISAKCDAAKAIPQKRNFFGVRYKMNEEDGERFMKILGEIADDYVEQIREATNDYGKMKQLREQANQNYIEKESINQLFTNCQETLNKLMADLNEKEYETESV